MKETIVEVLSQDSNCRSSNVEIQQRSVEYLALSKVCNEDILVSRLCCGSIVVKLGFPCISIALHPLSHGRAFTCHADGPGWIPVERTNPHRPQTANLVVCRGMVSGLVPNDQDLLEMWLKYVIVFFIFVVCSKTTVLEEMPPFPERESSILAKLKAKKPSTDGLSTPRQHQLKASATATAASTDVDRSSSPSVSPLKKSMGSRQLSGLRVVVGCG